MSTIAMSANTNREVGNREQGTGNREPVSPRPTVPCSLFPVPSVIGLIGWPVGHSISPLFQQAAFDHLELAIRYEAWETAAEALAMRVASLRTGDRCGANVTVPHKEAVLPLLDELTEE